MTRFPALVTAALLATTFFAPLSILPRKSGTFDELTHLPSGYSYLLWRRVRLDPTHPPLIKELCALPLMFLDLESPPEAQGDVDDHWVFGRRFFEVNDPQRVLFWGRIVNVLLSLSLAVLVAVWAREVWGAAGGVLALLLYAFDPTIVAHAQLVTTDVGVAFFSTLFVYRLRKHLLAPSAARLIIAGAALGLALAAKFSALVLIPVAAALAAVAFGKKRFLGVTGPLCGLLTVAYVVLWIAYLFPDDPLFYVRAAATVQSDHLAGYRHFFAGELSPTGWLHYFLVAWLVKAPLPGIALLIASIALALAGRRTNRVEEAFLVVPAVAFFTATSLLADPIGVRYLIPVFPFAFVFTARIAPALVEAKAIARGIVAALLLWYVGEFAAIWPDHLSYFNQIAGGPRGGVEWLDDSNVDWGQGLVQLREYLDERGVREYRLSYFGKFDPRLYGIHGDLVDPRDLLASSPPPGVLILSAHHLARLRAMLAERHGSGGANWLERAKLKTVVGHAYYVYEVSA